MTTTTTATTKTPAPKMPGAPRPTTTRPTSSKRGATILKTTLVVGSIVATLVGADLAAQQDQAATNAVLTIAYRGGAAFTSRQSLAALPNLPVDPKLGAVDIDTLLNMQLAPIPSIAIPAPLTRSRSSR